MEPLENNASDPHAPYNRPQLKWVCGHAKDGCATCPLGPSSKGECRSSGLCEPQRKGDRYYCTRSSTLGGKCSEDPLPAGTCAHIVPPCSPTLSTRALRGRVCLATTIATIALLVLLFSAKDGIKHASAGPLTSNHAAIANNCSDCHEPGDFEYGLNGDLLQLHARSLASSEKCLDCHNLGQTPHNPHSMPSETLARLTAKRLEDPDTPVNPHIGLAAKLVSDGPQSGAQTHCASCHTEHKGATHDIQAMSDAQCQACHTTQSQAFTGGHPEFDQYPYERRTRIIFDHRSHLMEHFNNPEYQGLGANDCLSCHELDSKGALMKTKGFDLACASCHTGQIEGQGQAGALGIPFLQLPGIDTGTLAQRGYPVGQWPEYADGGLSPFMQAILQCDPVGRSCLETLDSVDWMDLREADEEQLKAAQSLAWLVKELLFMALTEDQQFLQDKLLANRETKPSRSIQTRLSGKLPQDVLLAAQQAWFPDLPKELPLYRAGILPQATPPPTAKATSLLAPLQPEPGGQGDDDLPVEEDLLGGDSGGDLLALGEATLDHDMMGDDLLATGDDMMGDNLLATGPGPSGDLLLAGAPEAADPLALGYGSAIEEPAPMEMKAPEAWSRNGGWYRSDSTYALYYRPTGHADAFLTEWLSLSAAEAKNSAGMRAVFTKLSSNKSPGLCTKCHSIDGEPDGTLAVNWHARDTEELRRRPTFFKHAPHFNNQGSAGCYLCHQFDDNSDYAAAFAGNRDPHHFSSSFRPMDKALCAQCHNPASKTDQCLHCHNYHVGTPNPKLPQNNFQSFINRKTQD